MNSSSGLTKKDSSRIGFVVSSLFSEALNVSEMHEWITHVMGSEATTPGYLVDLLEFRGPLFKIYETIGFVPHWPYMTKSSRYSGLPSNVGGSLSIPRSTVRPR